MLSFCATLPVSSHVHTLVSLSLHRFYPTYFRGLATILDLAIFLFLFGCCRFRYQFRFGLFYFLHFIGYIVVFL